MEKLKKYWWAVLGAIGAVLAFVVAVVSRRKPVISTPPRPELKDVVVPEAPQVENKPADKYAEAAKKIDESKANDRVAAGNERYR